MERETIGLKKYLENKGWEFFKINDCYDTKRKKKNETKHVIFKQLETKDKEKSWAAREKWYLTYREIEIRVIVSFSSETIQLEENERVEKKCIFRTVYPEKKKECL